MATKVKVGRCKWCDEIVVLETRDEFGLIVQKHRCSEIDRAFLLYK